MSLLLIIVVILLVLALAGGGWGYGTYGPRGFSLFGVILVIAIILWLLGYLH